MKKTNTWPLDGTHLRSLTNKLEFYNFVSLLIALWRLLTKISLFKAWGSELLMATKSTFLKLECPQATWTFIVYICDGWYGKNWQKKSEKQFSHQIFQNSQLSSGCHCLVSGKSGQLQQLGTREFPGELANNGWSVYPLSARLLCLNLE